MSTIALFKCAHQPARDRAAAFCHEAPEGTVIKFEEPKRSTEQNDKMWAMLTDISRQVDWMADGVLRKLPKDDWKAIITAGVKKSQRIAQGIDGGFVVLPDKTSNMSIREMKDVIEFAQFFGDSREVIWTDPREAA